MKLLTELLNYPRLEDEGFFCKKCGKRLATFLGPAEPFVDSSSGYRYSHFDCKTGKRAYVQIYKCPRRSWWRSGHDEFAKGKLIFL